MIYFHAIKLYSKLQFSQRHLIGDNIGHRRRHELSKYSYFHDNFLSFPREFANNNNNMKLAQHVQASSIK